MLARPKVGTEEHILLWTGSKNPMEKFDYINFHGCACGQYSDAYGSVSRKYCWIDAPAVDTMNRIAGRLAQGRRDSLVTFGELHKHLRAEWSR